MVKVKILKGEVAIEAYNHTGKIPTPSWLKRYGCSIQKCEFVTHREFDAYYKAFNEFADPNRELVIEIETGVTDVYNALDNLNDTYIELTEVWQNLDEENREECLLAKLLNDMYPTVFSENFEEVCVEIQKWKERVFNALEAAQKQWDAEEEAAQGETEVKA